MSVGLHHRSLSAPSELHCYNLARYQYEFEKALRAGDIDAMEEWLMRGAKPDVNGPSLIQVIASENYDCAMKEEIVSFLFGHGVDVNAVGEEGNTALHQAAAQGEQAILEMLFLSNPDFELRDTGGNSALHLMAENGLLDTSVIRSWAFHGGPLNQTNAKGETPLNISCRLGHYATSRELFLQGAEAYSVNEEGNSAFSYALARGIPKAGSFEPIPNAVMWFNQLSFAMLETIPTDAPVSEGLTPLVFIALIKHVGDQYEVLNVERHIRSILFRREVSLALSATDGEGNTPLHIAARRGDEALMGILFRHKGLNLNAVNHKDLSAIQLADRHGHGRIVLQLYKRGALVPEELRAAFQRETPEAGEWP